MKTYKVTNMAGDIMSGFVGEDMVPLEKFFNKEYKSYIKKVELHTKYKRDLEKGRITNQEQKDIIERLIMDGWEGTYTELKKCAKLLSH